jgi:hypothetical protein
MDVANTAMRAREEGSAMRADDWLTGGKFHPLDLLLFFSRRSQAEGGSHGFPFREVRTSCPLLASEKRRGEVISEDFRLVNNGHSLVLIGG